MGYDLMQPRKESRCRTCGVPFLKHGKGHPFRGGVSREEAVRSVHPGLTQFQLARLAHIHEVHMGREYSDRRKLPALLELRNRGLIFLTPTPDGWKAQDMGSVPEERRPLDLIKVYVEGHTIYRRSES